MMLIAALLAAAGPGQFHLAMQDYMTCLQSGLPAGFAVMDRADKIANYERAASRCTGQRRAAIAAAIAEREPGTSEADARTLAVDIIDQLDPRSSEWVQR